MSGYRFHTPDQYSGRRIGEVPASAVWVGFMDHTTAHGIPHVRAAPGPVKTIFWLLVSLACTSLFLWNAIGLVNKYKAYNVSVSVSILNERELDFPAVTVCNTNPLKESRLPSVPEIMEIIQGTTSTETDDDTSISDMDSAASTGNGDSGRKKRDVGPPEPGPTTTAGGPLEPGPTTTAGGPPEPGPTTTAGGPPEPGPTTTAGGPSEPGPTTTAGGPPEPGPTTTAGGPPEPGPTTTAGGPPEPGPTTTAGGPPEPGPTTTAGGPPESGPTTTAGGPPGTTEGGPPGQNASPDGPTGPTPTTSGGGPTGPIAAGPASVDNADDGEPGGPNTGSSGPTGPESANNNDPHGQDSPGQPQGGQQQNDNFLIKQRVMAVLANMASEEKANLSSLAEDFILECQFNGYECNASDFNTTYNNMYGNCFTFNWGVVSGGEYVSYRPGPQYGLDLMFNIDQKEYMGDLAESAGVRVVVHPVGSMAFPEDEGISIGPGQHTYVGLRMLSVSRKGGRYGDCEPMDTHDLTRNVYEELYGVSYSNKACQKTCYQQEVINSCDCADSGVPMVGTAFNNVNVSACDTENDTEASCQKAVLRQYSADELTCSCPMPCSESTFIPTVSSVLWPSDKYMPTLKDELEALDNQRVIDVIIKDGPNGMDDRIRENLVKLSIYFQEFNYQTITEKAAYELGSFLSDMGGILGLYVGFSVLTILEFVELFADLLVWSFCRCRHRTKPTIGVSSIKIDSLTDTPRASLASSAFGPTLPPAYSP